MPTRENYKAKWLNALSASQTAPSITAAETEKTLIEVQNANISATIELNKLHEVMRSAAISARSLCTLMDECSIVGGVDLGKTIHGIDGKLGSMNMNLIARRLRDILKISEARIGILTAVIEDMTDANARNEFNAKTLRAAADPFMQASIETLCIGKNPTQAEMEEYVDKGRRSSYQRFDVNYRDLSDDWLETKLTSSSNPREPDEDESGDEADSDKEEETTKVTTATVSTVKGRPPPVRKRVGDIPL